MVRFIYQQRLERQPQVGSGKLFWGFRGMRDLEESFVPSSDSDYGFSGPGLTVDRSWSFNRWLDYSLFQIRVLV